MTSSVIEVHRALFVDDVRVIETGHSYPSREEAEIQAEKMQDLYGCVGVSFEVIEDEG